ncbi:trans-sulfuration enzyme family protein [Phenylobacterium sp. 58.2.17]|uniref:trans-sulfuration enzyme family protein n=1 Tax=Phenylobacterium sp. 58.2.17 TaxID=2969306 RepID=UPI002263F80B|nr:aminotransferase class I/II-fold pyridoxal phosphate-dependent enzyme [Phenylobacterium sp. 58.2.17]MCX7587271.1 PLP-dependent transferase [Phenylobacterium sp. 58.2.17]
MKDLSRIVRFPEVSQEGYASLAVPTHRASTIVFDDAAAYSNRKDRGPDGYSYGLHGTPTTRVLEAQLTALQQGERTVIVPSGQAGVTIVFLTVLLPGDKVLIPDTCYPPVRSFCINYLAARGIDHVVYDPMIGADVADLIDARTKLVWIESPGSTTMEFQDVPAIIAAAHAKGVLVGCDNTWATPLLFKPLAHGADFVMEALTKYVGGHSDLLLGSISVRDVALHRALKDTTRMIGIGVSPDECQLALRGLQTMGVRLAHVGRVGTEFARKIVGLPGVDRVLHPALPGCPGRAFWERDFSGASGVFSVVLKPGVEAALEPALTAMKTFTIGASWGGVRSLIVPMDIKPDRVAKPWTEDGVILRISIGLEDEAELWADLEALFGALGTR